MSAWYKAKGAAKWVWCKAVGGAKVPRTIALIQLDTCRACASAQCHEVLGMLVLTCGDPGVDRTMEWDPTCGCVVGWISRARAKLVRNLGKARIMNAMQPAGKSRCRARCDQGRWPSAKP